MDTNNNLYKTLENIEGVDKEYKETEICIEAKIKIVFNKTGTLEASDCSHIVDLLPEIKNLLVEKISNNLSFFVNSVDIEDLKSSLISDGINIDGDELIQIVNN